MMHIAEEMPRFDESFLLVGREAFDSFADNFVEYLVDRLILIVSSQEILDLDNLSFLQLSSPDVSSDDDV